MIKEKRNHSHLIISKPIQSTVDRNEELPELDPNQPIPGKPNAPARPDKNPGTASPEPGLDEPEKDDPTRIDEEPPIFNNY